MMSPKKVTPVVEDVTIPCEYDNTHNNTVHLEFIIVACTSYIVNLLVSAFIIIDLRAAFPEISKRGFDMRSEIWRVRKKGIALAFWLA